MRATIASAQPHHFLFEGTRVITEGLKGLDEIGGDVQHLSISQFALKYLGLTDAVSTWFHQWLGSLSYIGPIRAAPKRTYRLGEIYGPTHPDGREVPELIYRVLSGEQGLYDGSQKEFEDRLHDLMRILRLRAKVAIRDVGEDSFSIYLREPSGTVVNLADSAFGFSQVLPLIVKALLSRPGETFVVEQPEIHLNPAIQTRLADVFALGLAEGSTAIVETHSEHFIYRLRTLVAGKKLAPEDVAIYFVERGTKQSRVRRIQVEPDGSLGDSWPRGFMGDALLQARELNRAQRGLWKYEK